MLLRTIEYIERATRALGLYHLVMLPSRIGRETGTWM